MRARLFAGAVGGAALAAVSAKLMSDRQRNQRILRRGDQIRFGSLHSSPRTVIASDGVHLHAEVDDGPAGIPTIVFVHGWMCSIDNWHFQRAALRGKARMVFYDQRSHGASQRSAPANATIEQLGHDLKSVIDECAPDGDIILVGHSMGGMTVITLAAQYPQVVTERIKGVVLLATGAGHLMRGNSALGLLRPLIARASFLLDAGRGLNSYAMVRRFGLGPHADERDISMTEEMVLKNSSHVLLDFYPMFLSLNLYATLETIAVGNVIVVGGSKDLLTPIRHSRKLANTINGAKLVELDDTGHMVMFEEQEEVTRLIADMVGDLS